MTNLTTQRNRPESRGGEETLRIQALGERLAKQEASTNSHEGVESQPSAAGINALTDVANKHGITPGAMKEIIAATLQAYNLSVSHTMPSLDEYSFQPTLRRQAQGNTREPAKSALRIEKISQEAVHWSDSPPPKTVGYHTIKGLKALFDFLTGGTEAPTIQAPQNIDAASISNIPRVSLQGDADFAFDKSHKPAFPKEEARLRELRERDAANPTGRSLNVPEVSAEQGLMAYAIAEAIAKKSGLDRKTLLSLMYYGSIAEDYSRLAAATRKEKPLPYA